MATQLPRPLASNRREGDLPMKAMARTAVLLPAVLLVFSACATKSWVRENLSKKEIEINQRVETVDQRVDTVDQRVGTVEGQVTKESQRVDEVGSRVTTLGTT